MITDIHTHIYSDQTLSEYLAKAHDRVTRVITFPYWQDIDVLRGLDVTLDFAERHPGVVYALGTIDMEGDIPTQIARHQELFEQKKIVGIKLYPGYQHFFPCDERVDAIASLCGAYGKPLVFHSGLTHEMIPNTLLKYTKPEAIDELAVRHPDTTIVMSHFSYPNYMDAAAVLSKNRNVFSDISGVFCNEPNLPSHLHADLTAYLEICLVDFTRIFAHMPEVQEKVMFGTDYVGTANYLNMVDPYITFYERIFDPREHENVFHNRAEKLFFS